MRDPKRTMTPSKGKGARRVIKDNHSSDHKQQSQEDSNTVSLNEVFVPLPKEFLAEYKTGNDQQKTHNDKTRLVAWLTFLVVLAYTTVAFFQWQATNAQANAATEANRLLEESTKGRLSIESKLDLPSIGRPVTVQLTTTNVGHSLVEFGASFGYAFQTTLPRGSMPLDAGELSTLVEPDNTALNLVYPNPIPQELLEHLPLMSEVLLSHTSNVPTIYIYGRMDYQTLGRMHELEFCFFLARNDGKLLMPKDSAIESGDIVLMECSRWNMSR